MSFISPNTDYLSALKMVVKFMEICGITTILLMGISIIIFICNIIYKMFKKTYITIENNRWDGV